MAPVSLFSIHAVIILSTDDGSRIFAKYYSPPHPAPATSGAATATSSQNPYPDLKSQKAFEKGLLEKTAKQTGDILLYDGQICVYKAETDTMIYVIGSVDENEILLYNALLAVRDSMHLLFKQSVDKHRIIENYDLVALAIDEIVDDGVLLETDPTIISTRVSKAPAQDVNLRNMDPFSEQGVNNLAELGRAKLSNWIRQGF